MKRLPGGLWPVMITPFEPDNTIDHTNLKKLIDIYLASGAAGMFANCLSSEMFQLTAAERLELTKTVVEHCKGKVPVVVTGTFYLHGRDNATFIKQMHDLGADTVILISGIIAEPWESDDILKRRIEEIMEDTGDIPLGLYECPVPYKRIISAEMMGWLAGTGRFFYQKDTTCDNAAIKRKIDKIAGSVFQLYNADTPTALQSLRDGGMGISPISGNFYPELYGHFLKLHQSGDTKAIEKLNTRLIVMDRITHDFYPWSAKAFLERRGLDICTNTRLPMSKMTVKDKNIFDALYRMFVETMDEFGVKSVF